MCPRRGNIKYSNSLSRSSMWGGTLGEIGQLQKYFNRDSIGPPYSRMHNLLCPLVTNAKE